MPAKYLAPKNTEDQDWLARFREHAADVIYFTVCGIAMVSCAALILFGGYQ